MIWIGAIICVLVFVGIILHFDTKICLIGGGLLMCIIAGAIGDVVPAYCASLINGSVVYITCISMGYAAIMSEMGCTDHIIYALLRPLSKVKTFLVPGTVIVTWFLIQALSSASVTGAVVGSLLIPLMTGLGVNPATAAAAVLAGTGYGFGMNPGSSFVVLAAQADPTGVCTGGDIIARGFAPGAITLIVNAFLVMFIGKFLGKKSADAKGDEEAAKAALEKAANFKVNGLYAILPIVPLVLILLAVYGPLPDAFDVPTCMMIGWVIAMIVFIKDYKKVSNAFFRGQGDAFFNIITLMAAAAVFTKGMSAVGITQAMVAAMQNNPSIAKYAAAFGPMLIAALSGSGNAACLAFIESVLPHAGEIGIDHASLSSVCLSSASWGRNFSPVAAVTITVSRIAGVDPMEVVKHTVIPSILTALVYIFMILG